MYMYTNCRVRYVTLDWIEISHKSGKVYSAAAAGTTKDDGTSTASSTCTINCTDLRNLIRVVSKSSSFLDTFLKLAVRGIKQHCSGSSFMVLTFITSEGYSFEMIIVFKILKITRRTEHGQTSRVVWNMSLEWRSRSLDFVLESPDIVPLDSFIALAGGHDDHDLKDEDDCDEMRCSWSTLTDESCHL